ncbi:MAG: HAD hydrolase-like protein [Bacteroidota bacterium]|nr:HAD hydrolase-like protein [Bacteroidota bacterium]
MNKKGIIFDFNRTLFDPEKRELMPNAEETLLSLTKRGYILSLISSTQSPERETFIKSLPISNFFVKIIVTNKKKSAHHFSELSDIMGTNTKNTYVVGDRIKSEIQLGNSLTFNTIWFKNGKFAKETPSRQSEIPTAIITNLSEILNFI